MKCVFGWVSLYDITGDFWFWVNLTDVEAVAYTTLEVAGTSGNMVTVP